MSFAPKNQWEDIERRAFVFHMNLRQSCRRADRLENYQWYCIRALATATARTVVKCMSVFSESETIKVGTIQPCVPILALCTGKDVYLGIWTLPLPSSSSPVSVQYATLSNLLWSTRNWSSCERKMFALKILSKTTEK